jgi:hypothetical protein
VLAILEAIPERRWFLQVCGVLSIGKVLVLCLVPLFWSHRVPILMGVIVVGSVGSHMPRRFRHYLLFGSN